MLGAWRNLSPEKRWALVVGPLLVGVLTGVVATQINVGIGALTSNDPAPRIEAREVIVLNPSLRDVDRGLGEWPQSGSALERFLRRRRERLAPRAEVVLYNSGDRTAILNRMRFIARDRLYLPTCYLQGDLLVAESYDVTLPREMPVGAAVQSGPLRRKLVPDEPERLEFRFRLPPLPSPLDYHDDSYFYRLDAALVHDTADEPEVVGTMILALPAGPTEDQIWTRADARVLRSPSVFVPHEAVACMKRNAAKLRHFLAEPGERSTQLRSLGRRLGVPDA
jgi:hypothetical protein